MNLRAIRRNIKAVSPVIGTILVIFIILSTTATVMLWGIPYLNSLKAASQQASVAAQLGIIEDTINDIISGGLGSQRENTVSIEDGSFGINQDDNRVIISYSIDKNYNFTLTGLDPFESGYDPNSFELTMNKGSSNKAIISWLTTQTPYSGFEEFGGSDTSTSDGIAGLYSTYTLDKTAKCVARYTPSGSSKPVAFNDLISASTKYPGEKVDNVSEVSGENLWEGDDSHSAPKYVNLLYEYNISEPVSNMTSINFTWNGY
ncbi:MAG TPA: hypothetical protein ENN45_00445, partial [Bacteroidetes bacterium]|nr:hypothetical protein [Bacteroidota bacterium]